MYRHVDVGVWLLRRGVWPMRPAIPSVRNLRPVDLLRLRRSQLDGSSSSVVAQIATVSAVTSSSATMAATQTCRPIPWAGWILPLVVLMSVSLPG